VKKILSVLLIALAVISIVGCVSKPAPVPAPKPMETVLTPDILEHKGTALGANVPSWVMSYVEGGAQAIEKLPEYKGKYVIILDGEGNSRIGAQTIMDNMEAPVQIAKYLSTRVEQKFAGAQVGDRNEVQEYFENVVKLVASARFSGFETGPDWWVYLQYYKPGAKSKAEVERRTYRVIRIYSISRDILQKQLDKYLNDAEAAAAKTPEKQRAIDAVQGAFYEGF
jgi:hypothetical protein